jgi:hypothetical protein
MIVVLYDWEVEWMREKDNSALGWVVIVQVQHEVNLVEVAVRGVNLGLN